MAMPAQTEAFAFALHGGAGAVRNRDYRETEAHLEKLAAECREQLAAGAAALDVVEYAVAEMETSGLFDKAALQGQDFLRGYLSGWADGMEMFLKYANFDKKALLEEYVD